MRSSIKSYCPSCSACTHFYIHSNARNCQECGYAVSYASIKEISCAVCTAVVPTLRMSTGRQLTMRCLDCGNMVRYAPEHRNPELRVLERLISTAIQEVKLESS